MKKAVAILEIFVLLFIFVFANTLSANAESEISILDSVTEAETATDAEEELGEDDIFEDSPFIYSFTLESLAEMKLAYKILPEYLFELYTFINYDVYGSANIQLKKDAERMLNILESTTVILLDGDPESLSDMHCYVEDGMMCGCIRIIAGERHIVCTSFSPYLYNEEEFESDYTDDPDFVKTITNEEVSAQVFYSDDEYFSLMNVDGTPIKTRVWSSTGEQTLEEFEAEFSRFEFVKIGDLLNDYYSIDSVEDIFVTLSRVISLLTSFWGNMFGF